MIVASINELSHFKIMNDEYTVSQSCCKHFIWSIFTYCCRPPIFEQYRMSFWLVYNNSVPGISELQSCNIPKLSSYTTVFKSSEWLFINRLSWDLLEFVRKNPYRYKHHVFLKIFMARERTDCSKFSLIKWKAFVYLNMFYRFENISVNQQNFWTDMECCK